MVSQLGMLISLRHTYSTGLRGEQTNIVQARGDCDCVQVYLKHRKVAFGGGNHGNNIADCGTITSAEMYRSSLAFPGPPRYVDFAVPLPILNRNFKLSDHTSTTSIRTLDASRNGIKSETPSLSSMNTFIPVHTRVSPGLSRGVGDAFANVGGKNAC